MNSLIIIEDKKIRGWRVKTICSIFVNVLKRYGIFSLAAAFIVYFACGYFETPEKTCRLIQIFVSLPIIIPLSVIVASPAFYIPQKWLFTPTKISGKGLREFVSIKVRNISSYHIADIPSLDGYIKVNIRSKTWFGIEGPFVEIFIPPSGDIQQIETILSQTA